MIFEGLWVSPKNEDSYCRDPQKRGFLPEINTFFTGKNAFIGFFIAVNIEDY